MATLTIRDLNDEVKDRLVAQAKQSRRSMEAQARLLLSWATVQPAASQRLVSEAIEADNNTKEFGTYWVERFAGRGDDLEIPVRIEDPRGLESDSLADI